MGFSFDKGFVFVVGVPIYIIVMAICLILKKKKGKEISLKSELLKLIFVLYIFAVVGVTLFPIQFIYGDNHMFDNSIAVNFIPIKSIAEEIMQIGSGPFSVGFQIKLLLRNVAGNFVLLGPLGFLLPFINGKVNSMRRIILVGFAASFSIEVFQFLEDYAKIAFARIVDVDDIILNTLGAVVGYLVYRFSRFIMKKYIAGKINVQAQSNEN